MLERLSDLLNAYRRLRNDIITDAQEGIIDETKTTAFYDTLGNLLELLEGASDQLQTDYEIVHNHIDEAHNRGGFIIAS